ncbi:hypothetical protein QBC36DRAFT_339073 [Triangularia setosa]|uniref:Secreted protein n=1 Tax=Triangularia setosa TaxID=2587417 RepID=A0AAN7A4A4_9PEZI|nr:hypothetical protein QBC36DRAFT_339073 [Podospora setosa]
MVDGLEVLLTLDLFCAVLSGLRGGTWGLGPVARQASFTDGCMEVDSSFGSTLRISPSPDEDRWASSWDKWLACLESPFLLEFVPHGTCFPIRTSTGQPVHDPRVLGGALQLNF